MKKYILIIGLASLVTVFLSACKKGEDILGAAYGRLMLSSVFSGEASPLLVQVDGETKDTLNVEKPGTLQEIILKTGQHQMVLVNQQTKKTLTDTAITIETGKLTNLPKFYYTGTSALFDDLAAKPTADSMLVRFVTLDPKLPDVMDIEISLWDFGGTPTPLANKKIKGIRKDKFSNFVQFPNPAILLPPDTDPSFFYYTIEGYDPAHNNKKVMAIEDGSISYIYDFDSGGAISTFIANDVISLGIDKQPDSDPTHVPTIIFSRIAQ